MTRRDWLFAAGCSIGVPVTQPRTRLPLGFSLYGMKSLSLTDAIGLCSAIGYDGVELAVMPGYPAEPRSLSTDIRKDLRKQLGDAKLDLHGIMDNLTEPATEAVHLQNLDRLKAAAELGHAVARDGRVVLETILGNKPAQWDTVKGLLVERLGAWAEAARATKSFIAIKPHVANALHRVADAAWLVKQVGSPHLRLAFDYSHFQLRGVPMAQAVATLGPVAAFVHVKDAQGTADKFEFLLPGEGGTNYVELAKHLVETGYRGPVVVEVSGMLSNKPGYDAEAAARKCYANLKSVFGMPRG